MKLVQTIFLIFALSLLAPVLAACSSDDPVKPDAPGVNSDKLEPGKAADELYNRASQALDREDYKEAAKLFEELDRQYPYSRWATQSQLMAAYALYSDMDYIRAQAALDRFIELHPGYKNISYAYYLKALSYYEQISDVKRDQSAARAALAAFNTVIRRFPDTKYARDSRFKRDLTLNHLAGKEMEVGRFYLERNQINAAINRFKNVIENYQTTTHVPEALHRLVEAYRILGLEAQARRIAAVLGYNYPKSKWYQYSYRLFDEEEIEELRQRKGWMELTLDTLFSRESPQSKQEMESNAPTKSE